MAGQVHIVGAGCGDAGLITVRGRALLQSCQAVVYDELIDRALLELVPPGAERIPVGKRAGHLSAKQVDINNILIAKAREGKTVVRLKGGDPYVFGRGGEEALALKAAGIPYTVTPGVSSALYIPMEAGIPVTHRAVSRSVHIVTAHTAEKALPENLPALAKLEGTLVFLMGLHALPRLAAELIGAGKSPGTPAAVLSGGNAAKPAAVRGTLADIAEGAKKAGVEPPAVIVVGDVAAMDLRSPEQTATVGLTGTDAFQARLERLLVPKGLRTVRVQRAGTAELPNPIPWEALPGGWLAFTSGNGVEAFFRRLTGEGVDLRRLSSCKFAVIGKATGKALGAHGVRADLCPEEFTGEALARALEGAVSEGEAVWLFDSAQGSGAIPAVLGARCRRISLYDTVYETVPGAAAPDYLLLGSAGAVNALAASGYEIAAGTVPVCIGPVCAAAFEKRYGRAPLRPEEITTEAMAALVLEDATRSGSRS